MADLVSLKVKSELTRTSEIAYTNSVVDKDYTMRLADGKLANQADQVYASAGFVLPSAKNDFDLFDGSLLNEFNEPIIFSTVKAIIVLCPKENVSDLILQPALTNKFSTPFYIDTTGVRINPGGIFISTNPGVGWRVGNGASVITLNNKNTAAKNLAYEIIFIGVAA